MSEESEYYKASSPWNNPKDPGFNISWHTGKKCSTPDCLNPAGTAWSEDLCSSCTRKMKNEQYAKMKRRYRDRVYNEEVT